MAKLVKLITFCLLFIVFTSFRSKKDTNQGYYIIITKHNYELTLYDDKAWLVKYPVVFGNKDLRDKMHEGDKETPEGTFTIVSKRLHEKWDRFIMLDYPTPESYVKFNARKAQGLIPKDAQIGGGIGIHGTWPHEGYTIDRYENWTDGCISLKNEDIEELFSTVPVGTKVIIEQ
jgi:lipoprotein-anchoring transpeptidase ErfK/SrfK